LDPWHRCGAETAAHGSSSSRHPPPVPQSFIVFGVGCVFYRLAVLAVLGTGGHVVAVSDAFQLVTDETDGAGCALGTELAAAAAHRANIANPRTVDTRAVDVVGVAPRLLLAGCYWISRNGSRCICAAGK